MGAKSVSNNTRAKNVHFKAMRNKRGPLKMPYVPITKHGPFTVKGNRDPRKHTLFSSETYLTMH